eukprot:c21671_g1_i1 orf=782-1618(-)
MASKGFAAVVRRLPRLCSLLRPLPLRAPALLPADTQVRELSSLGHLPCRIASPAAISLYEHRGRAFRMAPRHLCLFSTSSPPQGESSTNTSSGDSKASLFREVMSSFATAPMVPMFLGVAGAVPFLALTPPFPYVLPLPEVLAANPIEAQALYGAVILAFLGGPHWGLAMVGIHASPNHKIFNYASNSVRYVWSVVPSLLAWPALLMTTVPKLQFLICSFGLVLAVDVIFAGQGLTPPWYLPLRLLLSGIVILCLSASLLEVLFTQKLERKEEKVVGN